MEVEVAAADVAVVGVRVEHGILTVDLDHDDRTVLVVLHDDHAAGAWAGAGQVVPVERGVLTPALELDPGPLELEAPVARVLGGRIADVGLVGDLRDPLGVDGRGPVAEFPLAKTGTDAGDARLVAVILGVAGVVGAVVADVVLVDVAIAVVVRVVAPLGSTGIGAGPAVVAVAVDLDVAVGLEGLQAGHEDHGGRGAVAPAVVVEVFVDDHLAVLAVLAVFAVLAVVAVLAVFAIGAVGTGRPGLGLAGLGASAEEQGDGNQDD